MSERIVNIITHNNKKNDDAVSFLKNSAANKDATRIKSINIIVSFLLNTENTSKLPSIKIAYKNETM